MLDKQVSNKLSDSKQVDVSNLCQKMTDSANQVVNFLESKLQPDGSFELQVEDLACYFKSPMMFITAKKPRSAELILTHIKKRFMQTNGDFITQKNLKSANSAYCEYWPYPNGWIVRAAYQLGMSDISKPGYKYLAQFSLYSGAYLTNLKVNMTDVLSIAHYGLINLEMDNTDIAIIAGKYLCEAIHKQSDLESGFYLRFDEKNNMITDFPQNKKVFYYVSTNEPNQLYFMIGYPAAFLALLYKRTHRIEFLDAAKFYLAFSLSCDESIYSCNFSHKIAWAASLLYECTRDEKYLTVIDRIANYFLAKQENGMWFTGDVNVSYDQSAEIACWFLDIAKKF